jgi:hypothetical protein
MVSWVVMRVLEGLNQRELLITADLNGRTVERAGDGGDKETG